MINPLAYTIAVRQVVEDGTTFCKATVKELPDVGCYGDSVGEAYELAVDAIETLYEMAVDEGRDFPRPAQEENEFSGRITLRLPKTMHRQVAMQAELDDVSLNQYLLSAIAQQIGHTQMLSAISAPVSASSESKVLMAFPSFLKKESVSAEVING